MVGKLCVKFLNICGYLLKPANAYFFRSYCIGKDRQRELILSIFSKTWPSVRATFSKDFLSWFYYFLSITIWCLISLILIDAKFNKEKLPIYLLSKKSKEVEKLYLSCWSMLRSKIPLYFLYYITLSIKKCIIYIQIYKFIINKKKFLYFTEKMFQDFTLYNTEILNKFFCLYSTSFFFIDCFYVSCTHSIFFHRKSPRK
jgi:hypothetical protein